MALARSAGLVAGIDFGHSHVAVALGDMTGSLIAEERPGSTTGTRTPRASTAPTTCSSSCSGRRPGAGRHPHHRPRPAGPDDRRCGPLVGDPPRLGRGQRPEAAGKRFGAVVHIDNDANLGALAEHRHGVARGHDSSVFVKVSSGVGAGIVLEDRLFHGNGGTAGEIGHLTLDENGPVCRCGSRGCLEAYTSTVALQSMMERQMPGRRASTRSSAPPATATSRPCARSRTPGSTSAWALASVVNLLNPALVVVGGEMARAGELLLESARIGLRRHALDAVASTPVVASELGERASLIGAVLLAAERTHIVG